MTAQSKGDRHRLLFSAAANLAEFGCPPALAHALLSEAGLDSGLSPADVRRQIDCGLGRVGTCPPTAPLTIVAFTARTVEAGCRTLPASSPRFGNSRQHYHRPPRGKPTLSQTRPNCHWLPMPAPSPPPGPSCSSRMTGAGRANRDAACGPGKAQQCGTRRRPSDTRHSAAERGRRMKAQFQTAADLLGGWRDDVLSGTPPTMFPIGDRRAGPYRNRSGTCNAAWRGTGGRQNRLHHASRRRCFAADTDVASRRLQLRNAAGRFA